MKGGKAGRKRRPSNSSNAPAGDRRKPKKSDDGRPAGAAPKKGSRKKPFGARSTTGNE